MSLIVKSAADGNTYYIKVDPGYGPLKDILWGKFRIPEEVRSFILENWYLPDVSITVTGNLECGSYTVSGKGPGWQREIVVEEHQVCKPKNFVCSNDKINKLVEGASGIDVRMTVWDRGSFVELVDITPTEYHIGKFDVMSSAIIRDLISGSSV